MAAEARKADDLAAEGGELGPLALARRPRAHPRAAALALGGEGDAHGLLLGDAAHGADQGVAGEFAGRPGIDDLAVAHDHHPVGGAENLAQQMGDEDAGGPACHGPADKSQELAGGAGVERGGGLVQDDELQRLLRHGEGPGHLHHLAARDGEIADDGAGRDAMAGKDLVELARDQRAGLAPPGKAGKGRMHDPQILRHRQIGAERKLLEHAADAVTMGDRRAIARGEIPAVHGDAPAIRGRRAGEDVHQCRFAGAVMADESEAFARADGEIDTGERADGAELLFDAVQRDDLCGGPDHDEADRG